MNGIFTTVPHSTYPFFKNPCRDYYVISSTYIYLFCRYFVEYIKLATEYIIQRWTCKFNVIKQSKLFLNVMQLLFVRSNVNVERVLNETSKNCATLTFTSASWLFTVLSSRGEVLFMYKKKLCIIVKPNLKKFTIKLRSSLLRLLRPRSLLHYNTTRQLLSKSRDFFPP